MGKNKKKKGGSKQQDDASSSVDPQTQQPSQSTEEPWQEQQPRGRRQSSSQEGSADSHAGLGRGDGRAKQTQPGQQPGQGGNRRPGQQQGTQHVQSGRGRGSQQNPVQPGQSHGYQPPVQVPGPQGAWGQGRGQQRTPQEASQWGPGQGQQRSSQETPQWGPGQGQQRGPQQGQQSQQRGSQQGQQGQQRGQQQSQQGQQRGPQQGQLGQQRGPQQGQQSREVTPPQGAWGVQQGQQSREVTPPQGARGAQQGQQMGPQQGQQSREVTPPQGAWGPQQGQQMGPQQGQQSRDVTSPQKQAWGTPQAQPLHEVACTQEQQSQDVRAQQSQALGSQQGQQTRGSSGAGRGRGKIAAHQQVGSLLPETKQKLQTTSISSGGGGDGINVQGKISSVGKLGRRIPVSTNHFELKLGKVKKAIHYDYTMEPDRPKKAYRMTYETFRRQYFPDYHPGFDGARNIFSACDLPFGDAVEGMVTVSLEEGSRPKEYKIKIKKVAVIDLEDISRFLDQMRSNRIVDIPMIALQALEVVLRHTLTMRNINVGRSFFSTNQSPVIKLGNGMEMYRGTFQAINLGWKPFLNVDVANKAFPMQIGIFELIKESVWKLDPNRDLQTNDFETINSKLRNIRVQYALPNNPASKKVYRINGLCESARQTKFKKDNGETLTIEQYYLKEKNVRLTYPNMPCVWVGSKESRIKVPIELCTILPGQVTNSKLGPNETREMIKHCATSTGVRKSAIHKLVQQANYNQDKTIRDFDLYIDDKFQKIDARVLNPPDLQYANKIVRVSKGTWMPDKFLNSVQIPTWTILNVDRRTENNKLQQLAKDVKNKAIQLGIQIGEPILPFESVFAYPNQMLQKLRDYFLNKKNKVKIIFVVINDSDKSYNYVKEAAEIAVGCLTQCIKSRTLQRLSDSTVSNILLKVNAKLNGVNHILHKRPRIMNEVMTMIMGADVTHPSPDSRDIPSVAAITASHDPNAFMYNICWRLQPPKVEVISDMEAVTREQLLFFARKNNGPPGRIIFYRDGVSDGQFKQVLQSELQAIRKACGSIAPNYKPQITFLVVQKRHHTRLFPENKTDSDDRNNNVPAGTCVDTEIVNPTIQNFFLVSHASIQGVAKPTKYVTLWDDSDLSNDELQSLTYYLCHLFARCTRSVSYPAPTYYAHLAAARAKVYCETKQLNMNRLDEEQRKMKIQDCIIKDLPMFFI